MLSTCQDTEKSVVEMVQKLFGNDFYVALIKFKVKFTFLDEITDGLFTMVNAGYEDSIQSMKLILALYLTTISERGLKEQIVQ